MIGGELLGFRSERIKEEWESDKIPELLRKIVIDLALRRWELLKMKTEITSIFRTKEENARVNANSMTHCEWRAVDLAVDKRQVPAEDVIRTKLNAAWPTGIKSMPRVPKLDHNANGLHYHIQITKKEATK